LAEQFLLRAQFRRNRAAALIGGLAKHFHQSFIRFQQFFKLAPAVTLRPGFPTHVINGAHGELPYLGKLVSHCLHCRTMSLAQRLRRRFGLMQPRGRISYTLRRHLEVGSQLGSEPSRFCQRPV
jgi:hypothetical protein